MLDVSAIVLCGGLGTRLRPVIRNLPKCLAPVNGRPFLFYILDQLVAAKVKRIVLAVNYLGEMISNTVGTEYKGVPISYSYDKIENGGTGHAARMAVEYVDTEDVLIMNGDTYIATPIVNFLNFQRCDRALNNVFINMGWIKNMGVYLTTMNTILECLPTNKPYRLEESFMIDAYKYGMSVGYIHCPFLDIGTPESYAQASEFMREFAR